jgi:protein O-mannosyl-transferase
MPKHKKFLSKKSLQAKSGTSVPSVLPLGMLAGVVLIVVAVFIAYYPSIRSEFILDDDKLLTANEHIQAGDGLYRFWLTTEAYDYWPAANTTLWIEWRLWNMKPAGYRITNLVLHIAASLLIWLILEKLSLPGSFLAALLFALHPVNVESTAWIAQRKDALAIVFLLLSILWYLKNLSQNSNDVHSSRPAPRAYAANGVYNLHFGRWYWLSLAAFVLGMLCKGSIAILPLLLLVIGWWLRPGGTVSIFVSTKMGQSPFVRRDLARTAPFFIVAAVLTAVNVWFQTHGSGEVFRIAGCTERLLGAGAVIWFYLFKAILPINLVFIYPLWQIDPNNPRWWLPLIAAAIVTVVLWRYRKGWGRPILFAWGYFCVALMPVMGFADVGFMKHSLVADHYQHIAIIGVIALTTAGWNIWRRRLQGALVWAAKAVAVSTVSALALLTWQQNGSYCDAIALYRHTLEKNPGCWLIHNNLGVLMYHAGQKKEAIEQYEHSLRLNPEFAEAHNNLGNALGSKGQWQEAIECYRRSLKIMPENSLVYNNLAWTLSNLGRFDEAIEQYKLAIKLNPNFTGTYDNLADTLEQAGRLPEAIEQYQQALRLEPNMPQVHVHIGADLTQVGRLQEAIEHFQQAMALKSDFTQAYYSLALAYAKMHESARAVDSAQQALKLARSQGETTLAKQIEEWLDSYRASLSNPPNP